MNEHLRRFEEGVRRCSAALYDLAQALGQAAAKMAPILRAALEEVVRRRYRAGGGNARDRRRRRRSAWREALTTGWPHLGADDSEAW